MLDIHVLVVEDNRVVQQYIKAALATDNGITVCGFADNGISGLSQALQVRPHVILLDLYLPGMDGIELIERVMHEAPCPIVVLSGELDRHDRDLAFEAQRAGAVCVLPKPQGITNQQFETFSGSLCRTIHLMSQVKVTRRWLRVPTAVPIESINFPPLASSHPFKLVAIGCSTGGPSALYSLLDGLGGYFPFSVVVAQHIEKGFGDTLCEWLNKTGCVVRIPLQGEVLQPGVVYLAPDDRHLVIGPGSHCHLVDNPEARFTPSVDMLFDSIAENIHDSVCAMLLTGMGSDGASGLLHLYRKGAYTVAEDQNSCVVFGMPAAAIEVGAVHQVAELNVIGAMLQAWAKPDGVMLPV